MIARLMYILILIILPFALAFGLIFYVPLKRMKQRSKCTEVVNAVIVDLSKHEYRDDESGETNTYYYPMYKYEFRGMTYFQTSDVNTASSSDIGRTVQIRINPNNPKEIYEKQGCKGCLLRILFIFMGLLSLAVGIYICINFPKG